MLDEVLKSNVKATLLMLLCQNSKMLNSLDNSWFDVGISVIIQETLNCNSKDCSLIIMNAVQTSKWFYKIVLHLILV